MDDQEEAKFLFEREGKPDVLYSRVDHALFMKVYKGARKSGFTMGLIVRMCVEASLEAVLKDLYRIKGVK